MSAIGVTGELLTVEQRTTHTRARSGFQDFRMTLAGRRRSMIPTLYQSVLRNPVSAEMLLTGHDRIRERERVAVEYVQG